MAGKEQKKPDDILHIKLHKGENQKVDKIIEFFSDGRPKKYTVIEALSEYIDKLEALNKNVPLQATATEELDGKSFLKGL